MKKSSLMATGILPVANMAPKRFPVQGTPKKSNRDQTVNSSLKASVIFVNPKLVVIKARSAKAGTTQRNDKGITGSIRQIYDATGIKPEFQYPNLSRKNHAV